MNRIKYTSVIFIALLAVISNACKLSKGFEALEVYNYFEAKNNFEKSLKKQKSPAAYGLSIIYFNKDNPFHNLDSAYHYGLLSVEAYKEAKDKKQAKWKEEFDFTLLKAKRHRAEISNLDFKTANNKNTVTAYQYFVSNHPWSKHVELAERRRDSLAFLNAKQVGSSLAYAEYLEKYEESNWRHKAKSLLYRAQFEETVEIGETKSYLEFIHKYPNNPLIRDAYYQIYSIETKENSIAAFSGFIRRFPDNPFINEAWKNLYRLSIADYDKEAIHEFATAYPDFPFKELIAQDLKLVGVQLYQFIKNKKYGFMNKAGDVVIAPFYEYAGQFNNGLAVVSDHGEYGYINKDGKQLIDYKFEEAMDFDKGRAIVVENGKYGIIDVSGAYVLLPQFKDIGVFSEGLVYAENDTGFQYYTMDGALAFTTIFDDAFAFKNGVALVRKGDKKGYIGLDGAFIISVTEGELRHFNNSLYVHVLRDSMNLMTTNGKYLFEESFDEIGVLVNNRAIIEKDNAFGYLNEKGEIVIPMEHTPYSNYMQFAQFEKGHVVIKRNNKYAMMDSVGNSVLPAIFTGIGSFGKLIPVSKGRGWGYSNHKVRLKINYQYDYAYGFIDGGALVEKDGLMGMIGLENEEIVPIEHESIKRMSNTVLLVKSSGFYGLITNTNNTLVAPKYDRIHELSPQLYQLIKGQQIAYFDVIKNELISLKE